jgi:hypothetical protein
MKYRNGKRFEKKVGLKFKIRLFFAQGFFRNNIVRCALLTLVVLNAANWIALAVFINAGRSYSIILHYNVYFGVDLVGEWWQAYLAPALATALILLNIFLAWKFYGKKERAASYVLLAASVMIQLSSAVASASVALVNW